MHEKPKFPMPRTAEWEVSQESQETLATLRGYLAGGYLLHGSKDRIEILEPRQAADSKPERITGKQLAVYASEHLEPALFMALKEMRDKKKRSMRSGYSGRKGRWRMYGDNTILTPGYVHVLSRDTFELDDDGKGDTDWISRTPVKPVDVIRVSPDIFNLFDNVDLELK